MVSFQDRSKRVYGTCDAPDWNFQKQFGNWVYKLTLGTQGNVYSVSGRKTPNPKIFQSNIIVFQDDRETIIVNHIRDQTLADKPPHISQPVYRVARSTATLVILCAFLAKNQSNKEVTQSSLAKKEITTSLTEAELIFRMTRVQLDTY